MRKHDELSLLTTILHEVRKMSTALDNLKAQVEQNTTVTDSAITLLQGLKQQLDDAIASGNPAAIQTISDNLGTETQKLAAAITANTPADPSTPLAATPTT